MKHRATAVLAVAFLIPVLAAGCAAGPEGPERLQEKWTVNVGADGPFQVAVPMVVHADGPTFEEWLGLWRASRGQVTFSTLEDEAGHWIVMTGNGTMTAEAASDRREDDCCLEAYREAVWSVPMEDGRIPARILEGEAGPISLNYAATSSRCWREANFAHVGGDQPGPLALQGSDQTGCPG